MVHTEKKSVSSSTLEDLVREFDDSSRRLGLTLKKALLEGSKIAREDNLFPLTEARIDVVKEGKSRTGFGKRPLLIVKEDEILSPEISPYPVMVVLTDQGELFTCERHSFFGEAPHKGRPDFSQTGRRLVEPGSPDYLEYGLAAFRALVELINQEEKT